MSDEQSNEIRVTVEMSDDFQPGERTAAALAQLVDALHDEHSDDDVGGFAAAPIGSFTFAAGPSRLTHFEAWPCKWKMTSFDGKGND